MDVPSTPDSWGAVLWFLLQLLLWAVGLGVAISLCVATITWAVYNFAVRPIHNTYHALLQPPQVDADEDLPPPEVLPYLTWLEMGAAADRVFDRLCNRW